MRSPPGSLGVCPPLTHPASLTVSIPLSLSMRWPPCFHPFQCAKNILVLLVHWASICSDLLSEARATSDLALFTHLLWTTQSLVRHQIHISTRTATGTEQTPPLPKAGLTPIHLCSSYLTHCPLLPTNPLAQDPILGVKLLRGDILLVAYACHYAHWPSILTKSFWCRKVSSDRSGHSSGSIELSLHSQT